jgi:NAD-dependent deacetylase
MKTVILTGAGISAESGIRTFRDSNGLWEGHRVEEVASPQGFVANPELVNNFYNERRDQLDTVEPNEAHKALAKLESVLKDDLLLITQNVDDLHERAGSKKVLHMHGELLKKRCSWCHEITECDANISVDDECKACKKTRGMRPHIVWFGEMPFYMAECEHALQECELFISIGTSGNVYPAAGFCSLAKNAVTVEINLKKSEIASQFDEAHYGKATIEVTKFVDSILETINELG